MQPIKNRHQHQTKPSNQGIGIVKHRPHEIIADRLEQLTLLWADENRVAVFDSLAGFKPERRAIKLDQWKLADLFLRIGQCSQNSMIEQSISSDNRIRIVG